MALEDTTPDLGRAIAGRYRLVREIGRGAMATVYEAVRFADGERVAVKVLHPHLAVGELIGARFDREARVGQGLEHPGLVRNLDAGTDADGTRYLVMELLEGQTLREGLDAGRFTKAQALWIVTEVLRALAVAHRAGIVHRDLKPENVFIARVPGGCEVVKLLDFGIARDVAAASVTRTETTLGTPSFMAPEQARSAKTVGPAADVWAVGVMLYELLTGRLPFVGEGPYDVLLRVCATPHPPVHTIAPDADLVVAGIVEQCLMKDPQVRPADAAALLRLLDPLVTRPRGLSAVVGHRCPLGDHAPATLEVPGRKASRLRAPADASEDPTLRPGDPIGEPMLVPVGERTLPLVGERTLPLVGEQTLSPFVERTVPPFVEQTLPPVGDRTLPLPRAVSPASVIERAPLRAPTLPAAVPGDTADTADVPAGAAPEARADSIATAQAHVEPEPVASAGQLVVGATLTLAGLLAGAWLWAA